MHEALARTMDVDTHEFTPTHLWKELWGEDAGRLATILEPRIAKAGVNSLVQPGIRDTKPISPETVWEEKGPTAPSAFDLSRRAEVMDLMGAHRALVFPSVAVIAHLFYAGGETARAMFKIDHPADELRRLTRGVIEYYNEWAMQQEVLDPIRARMVGVVFTDSVDEMVAQSERLLGNRVRALMLPAGEPPAGLSPADRALDPFWALAEKADAPVVMHVGGERGFLASTAWQRAPEFEPSLTGNTEFGLEPYSMSTMHIPYLNYLTVLVLGGVFERHPRLRFGIAEAGAYWVGGLAETLDLWGDHFRRRLKDVLSMKPSEYLARNVRVTPFHFEPVRMYFDRHSELQDVYCYSTDFPHLEGGRNTKKLFYDQLAPLGDNVVEKFFAKNGEWLLPA